MADLGIITLSRTPAYFKALSDGIGSLRELSMPAVGVLVNNGNHVESTHQAIRQGWWSLEPGVNTSFSHGHRHAADALRDVPYFLLLNDDLVCGPEFVERLWARREQADVMGALLLNPDGTVNHAGGLVHRSGMAGHIGRGDPRAAWERAEAPLRVNVTFAAALVNAATWRVLGGLDERYYYGYEDTDFCLRVLRAGGSVRCALDAVGFHGELGTRKPGVYDGQNAGVFRETWGSSMDSIVRHYVERSRPEPVEGV
jgi:GT2 family glycosyltransferase